MLVDEINRASPRTQAALLEPMEEHQVTVDGITHRLPDPFFCIATQNPHGQVGTFPLPESQLDRFALVLSMGLPDRDAEREILTGRGGNDVFAGLDRRRRPGPGGRGPSPRSTRVLLRAAARRVRARPGRRHPRSTRT